MQIDVLIPSRELPLISVLGLLQQERRPDNVIIWTDRLGENNLALEYLAEITELRIITKQSKNIGQKRREFVKETSSDYVWLLDDDAFPRHDCLSNFEKAISGDDFYQGMCIEPPGVVFEGEEEWDVITGKKPPRKELNQGDTKNLFCKTKKLKDILRNDKTISELRMFEHTYLTKKMEKLVFVPEARVYHLPSEKSFSRSLDYYLNAKKIVDLL